MRRIRHPQRGRRCQQGGLRKRRHEAGLHAPQQRVVRGAGDHLARQDLAVVGHRLAALGGLHRLGPLAGMQQQAAADQRRFRHGLAPALQPGQPELPGLLAQAGQPTGGVQRRLRQQAALLHLQALVHQHGAAGQQVEALVYEVQQQCLGPQVAELRQRILGQLRPVPAARRGRQQPGQRIGHAGRQGEAGQRAAVDIQRRPGARRPGQGPDVAADAAAQHGDTRGRHAQPRSAWAAKPALPAAKGSGRRARSAASAR